MAANPHAKRINRKMMQHTAPQADGSRWYAVGFVLAAAVLAASFFLAYDRPVPGWEAGWFAAVNNWPESWRSAFLVVTALGSTWAAVASVAVAFVFKMYWLTWRLAVSIVVGYGAVLGLKSAVDRARPEGLFGEAHIRADEALGGFPSGHAMLITLIMLSLLPYLPKGWRWLIVLPPILLVALSRLYLGVHVPLDVIGGAALGMLVVCFVRVLPRTVRRVLRLG